MHSHFILFPFFFFFSFSATHNMSTVQKQCKLQATHLNSFVKLCENGSYGSVSQITYSYNKWNNNILWPFFCLALPCTFRAQVRFLIHVCA